MIVFVIGKVDRAACHLDASGENRLMDMMTMEALAAKRRDESRMDVQHSTDEVARDRNELQEPGHADEFRSCAPAQAEDALTKFSRSRVVLSLDDGSGQSGAGRPVQSGDARFT